MEYHWWYVQNSMNTEFLDTNLTRILPLFGSCINLHHWISTLIITGTSLSSAPTFQHILHRSVDFKLVSDSCYCYPLWCTKLTLQRRLTSTTFSTFNNTSVTTYVHRLIISPPCLFKHMENDERVAMLFQCAFWTIHNKNCISLAFRCRQVMFRKVYTSISNTLYIFWVIFVIVRH